MAKNKKNKKNNHTLSIPEHHAILYLNWAINGNLEGVLGSVHRDVFEDLAEIHEAGIENRSHHIYISAQEICEYILKYNPAILSEISAEDLKDMAINIAIAVGWKQFQQVFNFDSRLLSDIYNIDTTNEKTLLSMRMLWSIFRVLTFSLNIH